MRFEFDRRKSQRLRNNPKRRIGLEEAREIFSHPYYEDCRSDDPEQFRAIGCEGEYYHLVTLWRSTKEEQTLYEKSR